mgnify:CR=1 FL=1
MDDLLKEAIADAKAVRETALANAKIALEEAFTPRLKSMLSRKIEAELSEEDDEMADDETSHDEIADDEIADDETSHDETSHDEVHDEEDDKEPADDEMMKSEEEDDSDHADDEVAYEGEDEDKPADDEVAYEGEEEDDDDLDLEAVLAELESELKEEEDDEEKMDESEEIEESEEVTEEDAVEEGEEIEENDVSSDIGKSDNKQPGKAGDSSDIGNADKAKHTESIDEVDDKDDKDEVDEDIDLEEVLKALTEEEDEDDKVDEVATLQAEIKEHRDVVKYLRAKLNEVNLLNAKLLFSNKLFRAFGLSNEQKLKVVETFDRTKNLREIKLVYATLAESFQNRKPISESKGSSSKPVASTKPQNEEVLSEGAELKNRFKKLANIL